MALNEDRDAIIEVLEFAEKLFDLLIPRLSGSDLQLFQDAWNETRPILKRQISVLRLVAFQGDSVWSGIERVGLTGNNLKMKLHFLAKAASGGWRKKLLDLLNKFLGSLAAGLPGVEPIKELKEWLEDQIEDDPEPDMGIVTAFKDHPRQQFHEAP
jgi:hypothetical protein